MELNWIALVVAALIPMVTGFLWYGPILGKQWQESIGLTDEDLKSGNMVLIFGLAFLMAFLLAMGMVTTIDAVHMPEGSYATFKHGALHGVLLSIFICIPVLVSNSLFQRNNAKNILINISYWIITMAIMGGLLDFWR